MNKVKVPCANCGLKHKLPTSAGKDCEMWELTDEQATEVNGTEFTCKNCKSTCVVHKHSFLLVELKS